MSQTQKYRHESTPSEQLRKALAELEEQREEIERLQAANEALKQELARRGSNPLPPQIVPVEGLGDGRMVFLVTDYKTTPIRIGPKDDT
jgi:hypothetical protein